MKSNDEQVLVVDRRALSQHIAHPSGLLVGCKGVRNLLKPLASDFCNIRFMLRSEAEQDSKVKQIIPYVIITDGSRFLSYTRGKQCDDRLKAKLSIGFGGHINPTDQPQFLADLLNACVYRELHEELVLPSKYTQNIVGVINDDSNEVGERHFGLVYWLCVSDLNDMQINSAAEICNLSILNTESDAPLGRAEFWSQLCWVHRISLAVENEVGTFRCEIRP